MPDCVGSISCAGATLREGYVFTHDLIRKVCNFSGSCDGPTSALEERTNAFRVSAGRPHDPAIETMVPRATKRNGRSRLILQCGNADSPASAPLAPLPPLRLRPRLPP